MFIKRLSILMLSLTLGLAACESRAPEPAPTESGMVTYGARAIEPRFSVVEAPDGILEVDAVTDKATAEVYYPMKPRDKVRVQWQGSQTHSTAVQAVAIARVLKFDLPKQWIEESAGQTVTLTYWYQTAGAGPEVSSAPLTLRVVGGAVDPVFKVLEAKADGTLDADTLGTSATVQVLHDRMALGDTLRVTWRGVSSYNTEIKAVVDKNTPVDFAILKSWVTENIGRTVQAFYTYERAGTGTAVPSSPISLRITSSLPVVDPVFKVLEAKADGTLDLNTLGANATVRVLHAGMTAGDTLRVTWSGPPSHNTDIKRVLDRAIPVEFAVPKAWVTENIGRTVPVFYTYEKTGTGTPVPSSPIQVRVTSNIIENGQVIAARLDARYNNTSNDCSGEPAFFCNGVMLRTVDSGNFLSWNPSANSIKKGAVSFSFLRRDMGIQRLARDAVQGIIFKNVERTLADGNLNVRVLCSFPSDAATDVRANQGCGAHPSYPTQSVYCSTLGISTLAQWKQHYESAPAGWQRNQHQCSFYAPSRSAFAVSLVARSNFQTPATDRQYHNEIMLQLWGQNLHRQVPLEALFYRIQRNPASGLASVKVIQRDYFNCTGSVLPIMRLTLADGAASAFSFVAADQGVAATDVANQAACRAKESK
jgi:hypothetical protein